MNNYRGFRRIYGVLIVFWIALSVFITLHSPATPFEDTKVPVEMKSASFYKLPVEEQRQSLSVADSDYAGLPRAEQGKFLVVVSTQQKEYQRNLFISGVERAVLPPVIGYVFFFMLIPWIVAGFRSKSGLDTRS
jgi:hypothetical protein